MKILVAEDSVTMRKVLEMTFAGENAEIMTVDSCERALEVARDLHPDLILADLSMNGLDGYGIAESVKNDPSLGGVPVIVMASQQRPYDEAQGQSCGVADFVTKPFDTQVLIDKANQHGGGARAPMPSDRASMSMSMPTGRPNPVVTISSVPADEFSSYPADGFASSPAAAAGGPPPLPPLPPLPSAPIGSEPSHEAEFTTPAPASEPVYLQSKSPASMSSHAPAAPAASSYAPSNGDGDGDASLQLDPSLGARLAELGLNEAQVEGVLRLSAEVVERVVWEVVPELAETLIREEIRRLTGQ